jgi:hypothetical protein
MAAFLATHDLHTPRVENVHRLDSVLLPLGSCCSGKFSYSGPGRRYFTTEQTENPEECEVVEIAQLSMQKGCSWSSQSSEFPGSRGKYRESSAITAGSQSFAQNSQILLYSRESAGNLRFSNVSDFNSDAYRRKEERLQPGRELAGIFPKRASRYIDLGCLIRQEIAIEIRVPCIWRRERNWGHDRR